jgi:hypothetical protein
VMTLDLASWPRLSQEKGDWPKQFRRHDMTPNTCPGDKRGVCGNARKELSHFQCTFTLGCFEFQYQGFVGSNPVQIRFSLNY